MLYKFNPYILKFNTTVAVGVGGELTKPFRYDIINAKRWLTAIIVFDYFVNNLQCYEYYLKNLGHNMLTSFFLLNSHNEKKFVISRVKYWGRIMNKGKNFKHLTFTQRIIIETLYKRRVPVKQIAEEIGVCFKTVYNELKRGECELKKYVSTNYIGEKKYKTIKSYSSNIAADKYHKNMSRHGADIKLGKDYAFADYIENKIANEKYTPLAVLGEIKAKGLVFDTSICVQTLYNYIHKGVFLNLSMKNLLFGKRTKRRDKLVIKKAPSGKSIEQRPQIVTERSEFGHWEMDCVCGPRSSRFPLLVLTERKTRKELIFKIEKQTVKNVIDCLNVLEREYGKKFLKVFKSITVDNGAEFADCVGMERSIRSKKKRTTIYYCHPYRSNERGTNERMNREIRRIFPKGTNFRNIPDEEISKAEIWLNNYPRGVLNYHTPEELFNYHLSLLN